MQHRNSQPVLGFVGPVSAERVFDCMRGGYDHHLLRLRAPGFLNHGFNRILPGNPAVGVEPQAAEQVQ